MEWVRGETVGHGSFGKVSLVVPRNHNSQNPPLMVVKSCGVSHSATLMNEKSILEELKDCPEIIRCYGDSCTFENGEKLYNVFLEYASGGALADKIKNCNDRRLPELEVRRYANAVLRGLRHIHKNGYVHCDIKLQNLLINEYGSVKIADFGLAKRAEDCNLGCELRGTPLYMSPEMVAGGEQGQPADIWALGCVVAEMLTGAPAWNCSDVAGLLLKIGVGEEVPQIPGKLSEEGKDFLGKCFLKDPRKRWTAEMLLSHPFVAVGHDQDDETVSLKDNDEIPSTSPRCPFDFPDWVSVQSSLTCSITSLPSPQFDSLNDCGGAWSTPPAERLLGLLCEHRPEWSVNCDDWVSIR